MGCADVTALCGIPAEVKQEIRPEQLRFFGVEGFRGYLTIGEKLCFCLFFWRGGGLFLFKGLGLRESG